MDWSEVTLAEGDDLLDAVHFHDIAESSFHGDQSLLENLDTFDLTELPGPSFARDSTVQNGGERDDFNIRLLKEKALKTMGVKEVSYELTFNDRLFGEQNKMNEVFDLLREAFQKMIDRVKRDLRPGDIVRVAIHNEGLDLPVFVPFRPMENMNTDTLLETLTHVLNSDEDVAFDSLCRVDVGAIRGGKGRKMSTLALKIAKKRSIVAIYNDDNICLVRATLVALAGACKLHPDEFRKCQMRQPTFTAGEMLIHFGVCPIWYYNDLRANHQRAQDLLTIRVCEALGIVADEPLNYACIPRLEEFLNINLYVISASMGDKFSYISAHHNQERKKVFLYHEDINDKEHFHAIPNITGFSTSSYFCQHCLVPFKKPYRHHCVNYCGVCQSYDCRKGREPCPNVTGPVAPRRVTEDTKHSLTRGSFLVRPHTSVPFVCRPFTSPTECQKIIAADITRASPVISISNPNTSVTPELTRSPRRSHDDTSLPTSNPPSGTRSCSANLGTLPHPTLTVSAVKTAPVRVVASVSTVRNHTAGKPDIRSFLLCVRPHVRNARSKIDAPLVPRSIRRSRSTLNLPVPTHVGDANESSRPCTIWGSECSVTRTRGLRSSSTTFLMTAAFSFNT